MPYRDPLAQWVQSSYDPNSPESLESAERAKDAQRSERADLLQKLFADDDTRTFDRMFLEFWRDDPAILSVLTARVAAAASVRLHRKRNA
jgi:hypothetical protein